MCEYCEDGQKMMSMGVIDRANFGWGYDDAVRLTLREAEKDQNEIAVFIDRGFLRMVDICDCECIEGGQKIAINFCQICGREIA